MVSSRAVGKRGSAQPPRAVETPAEGGGDLEVILCAVSLVAVVFVSPLIPAPVLTWGRVYVGCVGACAVDGIVVMVREVTGVDMYALVSFSQRLSPPCVRVCLCPLAHTRSPSHSITCRGCCRKNVQKCDSELVARHAHDMSSDRVTCTFAPHM